MSLPRESYCTCCRRTPAIGPISIGNSAGCSFPQSPHHQVVVVVVVVVVNHQSETKRNQKINEDHHQWQNNVQPKKCYKFQSFSTKCDNQLWKLRDQSCFCTCQLHVQTIHTECNLSARYSSCCTVYISPENLY